MAKNNFQEKELLKNLKNGYQSLFSFSPRLTTLVTVMSVGPCLLKCMLSQVVIVRRLYNPLTSDESMI